MVAMMPIPNPASVLEYVNTAIAVASFLTSERLPATIESIKSYFSRRRETEPSEGFSKEAKDLIALLIIDPDLLKILEQKIRAALTGYRKCLISASTPQESDACDRTAERAICDTLNRIKNRNNGSLPGDFLSNQWNSFGCVRVA